MSKEKESINYNEEPVYYCSECLSLSVAYVDEDLCYCTKCGSGYIEKGDINKWEAKYKDKYGHAFLEHGDKG